MMDDCHYHSGDQASLMLLCPSCADGSTLAELLAGNAFSNVILIEPSIHDRQVAWDWQTLHPTTAVLGISVTEAADALQRLHLEDVLFVSGPVSLSKSSLALFQMAARRAPQFAMIYADYAVSGGSGHTDVRHLDDHHCGCVRDDQDFGRVWLINGPLLRLAMDGFTDVHRAAFVYDLRLRLSEYGELIHLCASVDGHLYSVPSKGTPLSAYDYMTGSADAQAAFETVFTQHLQRIGACLPAKQPRTLETVNFNPGRPGPLASIIVPAYRRQKFIGAAIESALGQTEKNIEIIVVCNGGEADATYVEVQRFLPGGDRYQDTAPPVFLLRETINNLGFSLNRGLSVAQGQIYVQLDSDDRLKPHAVELILDVFRGDPRIGLLTGTAELYELDSRTGTTIPSATLPIISHPEWTPENGHNNLLRVGGLGAPRAVPIQVLLRMGGFSVNEYPGMMNVGEDYELLLRLTEAYRVGRIYTPIYEIMRHDGNTTSEANPNRVRDIDRVKDFMRRDAICRRQRLNAAPLTTASGTKSVPYSNALRDEPHLSAPPQT